MLFLLQLATGLFWTFTYILMIKRGFQDKSYGMPMVALCSNISWEYIFSFLLPPSGMQHWINLLWFSLDTLILLQCLRYGPQYFKKYFSVNYFYPAFLLTAFFSFTIILTATTEFRDWEGQYSAFASNFITSVLFIPLLMKRGNPAGQSLAIAICKMLGSLCATVAFWLYFESDLVKLLGAGSFIFDLLYILFLFETIQKTKTTPWSGWLQSTNRRNSVPPM